MKIPLRWRRQFDELMAIAVATIRAPHVRRPVPIELWMDTGSPWTAIAPRDAKKLNIPIIALKKAEKFATIRFAGSKFQRYLLEDVSMYMRDESGKIVKINLPVISVLWPTTGKVEKYDSIPSVLGCDFLTIRDFKLIFNPRRRVAFLENNPPST